MAATTSVWLQKPQAHFWQFPPATNPQTIPAAQIDPKLYAAALDARVPLLVASVYAITVAILNGVNRRRQYKPWPFGHTKIFFSLVILHNVFLACYSVWTFIGMTNTIMAVWPRWEGTQSLPAAVDALCKMHGPKGLGNAVSFNYNTSKWVTNPALTLNERKPDPMDFGRLWTEGLAFYGWLFYISKFYEVVDSLIILAKGKRSSILQTYHHAGAMFCLWAGIRYMSPPIWMFCWINSGIHSLMYTYYTLAALKIKVPGRIKRLLTSMQILQFLIGFTFAILHLFVGYKAPTHIPYTSDNMATMMPSATTTANAGLLSAPAHIEYPYYPSMARLVPSATTTAASVFSTEAISNFLRQALLRAIGDENLAANIRESTTLIRPSREQGWAKEFPIYSKTISTRQEYVDVNCIDTSGQAFAIYLNLLYLLPLTMLFVRFFVKSYLKRPAAGRLEKQRRRLSKSGLDTVKSVTKPIAITRMHQEAVGS